MLQEHYDQQRYSRPRTARWEDEVRVPLPPGASVEGPSAWEKTRETAETVIGRYPGVACGVALFAGIVLGWWIKRR